MKKKSALVAGFFHFISFSFLKIFKLFSNKENIMTEDEKIVQEAQRKEREHIFELMESTLVSIRDDARKYVEEFRDKYCVPKYAVYDDCTYAYAYEPRVNYDFAFKISYTLEFTFTSHISLRTNNDVCYIVSVRMLVNDDEEDPLSGCIFLKFGSYEKYVDAIKQACDMCCKKYLELHENTKDRFF